MLETTKDGVSSSLERGRLVLETLAVFFPACGPQSQLWGLAYRTSGGRQTESEKSLDIIAMESEAQTTKATTQPSCIGPPQLAQSAPQATHLAEALWLQGGSRCARGSRGKGSTRRHSGV